MNTKDSKQLSNIYIQILRESENISNTSMHGNSTRFQADHTAKFLPVGQENENTGRGDLSTEKGSDKIKEKLKGGLSTLKSLVETCLNANCKLKDLSNLMEFFNNPEFKTDLDELKLQLQRENQEEGINSSLAF